MRNFTHVIELIMDSTEKEIREKHLSNKRAIHTIAPQSPISQRTFRTEHRVTKDTSMILFSLVDNVQD